VTHSAQQLDEITYRNFNLCPHCALRGEDALLRRLCEGIPMISLSDGKTFHLLLADRPLPYPSERNSGDTRKLSACFWYSHNCNPQSMCSTVVVLPACPVAHTSIFRQIEFIADLLAAELLHDGRLGAMYEFTGGQINEIFY
jgi:hypothetical protein